MSRNVTHIVVPIDFSPNAARALAEAVGLAQTYQAELTVVYVIPQVIFHPDWATDLEDTIDLDDVTEEAQRALRQLTEPYRRQGVQRTTQMLAGGPHIEIVRLAHRVGTDLIVIGAHGRSDRKPMVMGSVAEKVVREALCSVLTVREPCRGAQ